MKILDVGCGQKKLEGSIGIDFSPMSDADIVLNLNEEKLPFDDNEIDYIYSSHCMEHLTKDGFLSVISEVYRVLKPTGSFFLTVPYFLTTANLANIFHNNQICFNEHTFRFFSSDVETESFPSKDYATPSCPQWGLRYSANSELNVEFSTEYVHFHYFSEFSNLSDAEKSEARNSRLNVVDQISYLLKPVKPLPRRLEMAPIETGSPTEFLKEQIIYIQEQVVFLKERGLKSYTVNDFWSLAVDDIKNIEVGRNGVVFVSGLLIPVYEVVSVFDIIIQQNQKSIDNLLK
ncbi:class I SAM-dependent methyltransferase [Vibrio aestuarianus]|uniref:class I SAM-dependent methyltransferase n=1 Tax=Vibrio aestuarianus TaxID=28171 RepID=UPI00237CED5D|nr:class I SAM-dependent methyltransferase [Vibrio aestuarianus]MDE1330738.1 class I SAM-dependent methyltransferase [Vibrio aestuarianus]